MIDLRSDTVTQPSPRMRRAMAEAEVGDDVYGEDPTVNRLQGLAAERLGFEEALFFPSGTMANQVALLLHLRRGQEVLAPEGAHLYEYELGAPAALAGALVRPYPAPRGRPDLKALRALFHEGPHQAPIGLITVENTHNLAGGRVVEEGITRGVLEFAREKGLPTHLDGARLFNAAIALNTEPSRLARGFTTAMFSLSKGLGAPVGSLLLFPKAMAKEARRYRKLLGGGMRQVGVLAAAGLVALEEGPSLLPQDHARAKALAEGLRKLGLEPEEVETNMVYLPHPHPEALAQALKAQGVLVGVLKGRLRLVTHRDLEDSAIERTLAAFRWVLENPSGQFRTKGG